MPRPPQPEVLYHFSCLYHWPDIWEDGELCVRESSISMERLQAAPDVVFLTSDPRSAEAWQMTPDLEPTEVPGEFPPAGPARWVASPYDKRELRLSVAAPRHEIHWWPRWSRAHGIKERWYRALAEGSDPHKWYVVERPVPSAEWIAVERLTPEGDRLLWSRTMPRAEIITELRRVRDELGSTVFYRRAWEGRGADGTAQACGEFGIVEEL